MSALRAALASVALIVGCAVAVPAPAQEVRVRLAGHHAAWADAENDLGAIPDATPIHLIFTLARTPERQAAFDRLLADQLDPSSARFHQWLTPTAVGEDFGPSPEEIARLSAWLQGRGLQVDRVQPNRQFVEVSGSSAAVSAALGTSLHRFRTAAGILRAAAAEPSLPAGLAPLVASIGGLSDVPMHTHAQRLAPLALAATSLHARAAPAYTSGSGAHLIAPADFAVIYHVAPVYAAGIKGTGQRVTVIGGSRLLPSDLNAWAALAGLPPARPHYIIPTGVRFADPGLTSDDDQGEGTLDFERVYGTAPGAQVDQVISAGWLNGSTNASLILYAINTLNNPILSLSFGACEALQSPAYVRQEDALFAQAAAQGISVFASSGDAGVAGCETHGTAAPTRLTASISDLCASASVTCVGGTQFADTLNPTAFWTANNGPGLASALGFIPEGAWNEPAGATPGSFVLNATGGGASTVVPKPVWQTGAGVPADGARDIPDLSFSASLHNAYFSCLAYAGADCTTYVTGFGGTSATAPAMAGIAALLNEQTGSRQGNLNAQLYRLAATNPNAFHDATPASSSVGNCLLAVPSLCNNSVPATYGLTGGLAGFALQTGYDLATGLGSLDVAALVMGGGLTGPGAPYVTLSAQTPTLTLTRGVSGANTIVATSANGFQGLLSLTCAVTGSGNVPPTCAISPGSLDFPGASTAVVTLGTVAPHSRPGQRAGLDFLRGPGSTAAAASALAGLLLWTLPHRRRLRTALMMAALAGLGGCGQGNFGTDVAVAAPTPVLTGGTSSGTYLVTVTGQNRYGTALTTFNVQVR